MVRDVDIQNIVMVDYMTSYVNNIDCHKVVSLADDEDEIWVINKNRFGKLHIEREWIYEIDGNTAKPFIKEYSADKIEKLLTRDDGQSLMSSRTLPTKPCEMNDPITKWVMNRNIEKIKNRGY